MTHAVKEIIGYSKKKRQDWFDESDGIISSLIEEKRQPSLAMENQPTDANKCAHKLVVTDYQKCIREVQNTWSKEKLQRYKALPTKETCAAIKIF